MRSRALLGLVPACLFLAGCAPAKRDAPASTATTSAAGMSTAATTSAPVAEQGLRAVPEPDVSRFGESARRQMQDAYASLQSKIAQRVPPLELAHAYGDMGKLFLAAGDPESAEACLLNAQRLAPTEMRWPYYLAQRFLTEGDPARAAGLFERALELQPDYTAALVWLGNSDLTLGRPEAAEPLFRKAASLEPNMAAAIVGLGRAALARRDYARAAEYFEHALSLAPGASALEYPLATAYRGLGDAVKAEAHLKRRGEVEVGLRDPLMEDVSGLLHSAMAYEMSGRQALIAGRFPEAAEAFRKGIDLAADNPTLQAELRNKLGTALFQMGDPRGGTKQFELALRRAPEFAPAHYSLGVVMLSTGRYPQAIDHLSAAVKSEPDYVDAHLRLGEAWLAEGRAEMALVEYQRVLTLDARVAEGQFGCAMALARLGRFREARDRLVDGMTANPEQPVFAHVLVRLLAAAPDDRVRDGRRAMALVQQWTSHGPKDFDRDEAMAMTFAELGQYDDAATWQRRAVTDANGMASRARREYLARNLDLYLHHVPCRVPWVEDPPYLEAAPSDANGR
jgi:tetratricopeptide (TPR) repeat protein